MAQFNFYSREVNCKIVYYGPGLSGKTTNVEVVHQKAPATKRGKLTSIVTEQDRTLFFDFMPMDLGTIAGMNVKLRLFTVPGQVYYESTRKIVLQEVDGVVFVADSSKGKLEENLESWADLERNLREHGLGLGDVPIVIQWNKRDLPNIMSVEELEEKVNILKVPSFEGVAIHGEGVFPTLKKCVAMVLEVVAVMAKKQGEASAKQAKAPAPAPKNTLKLSRPAPKNQPSQPKLKALGRKGKKAPSPIQFQESPVQESPGAAKPIFKKVTAKSKNEEVAKETETRAKPIFKKLTGKNKNEEVAKETETRTSSAYLPLPEDEVHSPVVSGKETEESVTTVNENQPNEELATDQETNQDNEQINAEDVQASASEEIIENARDKESDQQETKEEPKQETQESDQEETEEESDREEESDQEEESDREESEQEEMEEESGQEEAKEESDQEISEDK